MIRIRIGCLLLALSISCSAIAVEVENLFEAEIMVASQSARALATGARQGLHQVLVRVSGNSRVDDNPVVKGALSIPQDYYDQYSYATPDRESNSPDSGDATGDATQILKIHFESDAIVRLLRDAGLPVWGSNRPVTLLWIAMENETGRVLLSDSSHDKLAGQLFVEAKRRGLPILLPLLDLDDAANISAAAVWGGFQAQVDDASRRYDPDAVVSGRIYRGTDEGWSANWYYRTTTQWQNFQSYSIQTSDVIRAVIDRLGDALAKRYALNSNQISVWLRVEAVEQLSDYVQLSEYLENLSPGLEVSPVHVEGNEVLFRLSTEGKEAQLIELINMDQKLLYLGNNSADARELQYRWVQQ